MNVVVSSCHAYRTQTFPQLVYFLLFLVSLQQGMENIYKKKEAARQTEGDNKKSKVKKAEGKEKGEGGCTGDAQGMHRGRAGKNGMKLIFRVGRMGVRALLSLSPID